MARIRKNIILEGVSGMIGGQLDIVNDTTRNLQYVRIRPRTPDKKKRTKLQNEHLYRFYNGAVGYWNKVVKKNPELVQEYKKAAPSALNAYNMALKDYMNPPEIEKITIQESRSGHKPVIKIHATDFFRVRKVSISIKTPDGTELESGEAVETSKTFEWQYACTEIKHPVPEIIVTVLATDTPGHTAKLSQSFGSPAFIK